MLDSGIRIREYRLLDLEPGTLDPPAKLSWTMRLQLVSGPNLSEITPLTL